MIKSIIAPIANSIFLLQLINTLVEFRPENAVGTVLKAYGRKLLAG